MENDTISSSSSKQQLHPSAAMPLECCCRSSSSSQPRRRHRGSRPRRQRTAGVAALMITSSLAALSPQTSHAIEDPTHHRRLDRDGTTTNPNPNPIPVSSLGSNTLSKITRSTTACNPLTQHTILFTLYTDAHSITDNSWQINHASYGTGHETGNSGTYIASEYLGSGSLGYGAVVTHTICADKATNIESTMNSSGPETYIGSSALVESCYDLELNDVNGDGLTAPHSAQGGLAGGFSLHVDGAVVAEHRGQACFPPVEEGGNLDEWNECAVESGFETCGVRVCIVNDEDESGGSGGGSGVTKATLSGLSGSQCSFAQPQCDPTNNSRAIASSSTSASSLIINVDTDSFAEEVSWEARRSSKSSLKEMNMALQNDLILAGGQPVYEIDENGAAASSSSGGNSNVILGQIGVGVPLADNESYTSITCIPENAKPSDTCFDIRAYDAYGDGMGCGATGSLSITLEGTNGKAYGLTQRDDDMARNVLINGQKRLGCVNKQKLSKWSYCAVRMCADGTVIGLQGNQCDFGRGDELIDEDYADVDPLVGLVMEPMSDEFSGGRPKEEEEEEEDIYKEPIEMLGLEDMEWIMQEEDNDVKEDNEDNEIVYYNEEEDDADTWAEYYEGLKPGFREDGQPNALSSAVNLGGAAGQKGPRPNKKKNQQEEEGRGQKGPRPNKKDRQENKKNQQGQKGPRPEKQIVASKVDQEDEPDDTQITALLANADQEGDEPNKNPPKPQMAAEGLNLKPFSITLLATTSPLKYKNLDQLSDATSEYLVSYLDDNANALDGANPTSFELECSKSRQRIGSEFRWVMDCDGVAVFQDPSTALPRKKVLNDVIQDAFTGKSEKKFLDVMYDQDNGDAIKKKDRTKFQEWKDKKAQMKQNSNQQPKGAVNIGKLLDNDKKKKQNEKKQSRQDELEAKKQMKLNSLEVKGEQQDQQQGQENVMGYVSGSQYMDARADTTDLGYTILKNGDIVVFVDDDQKGGNKGRKNRPQQDQRRKDRNDDDGGSRRMLRSSKQ